MKHTLRLVWLLPLLLLLSTGTPLQAQPDHPSSSLPDQTQPAEPSSHGADPGFHSPHEHGEAHPEAEHHAESTHSPAILSVVPFIVLLLMIATGPIFFEHFWHRYYKLIAPALGLLTLAYYLIALPEAHEPAHALSEYASFIALLAPLYIASGGILIQIDREGTPLANLSLLIIGALIANVIGTTGASMLLIRPYIRLNRDRLKPYHIIFFIFMVSNIGGSLTPVGDPPLFLGFLKGVPFFWTFVHVIPAWLFALTLLSAIFYLFDVRNRSDLDRVETVYSGRVVLRGTRSFFWLGIIVGAVFLDPNVFDWVPAIESHGTQYSFLREIIQLSAGVASYITADKAALRGNEFTFEPINEVIFLFIGIFFAMMPALQLIGAFASSPAGQQFFSLDMMYWATGSLSGFLDNAPTYLNFLSAAMAKFNLDVSQVADVRTFASGAQATITEDYLRAISVAAVFFGAFTYIGNGPNFMVKSIAEERGVDMPSFFGYIIRYSLIILAPVLFLTWLIFFKFL